MQVPPSIGSVLGFYRDNGEEDGSYYILAGFMASMRL